MLQKRIAAGRHFYTNVVIGALAGTAVGTLVPFAHRRADLDVRGFSLRRVVSFDQLDSVILPNADDAFCCLGTTRRKAGSDEAFRRVDFDYVVAFARAARRAGVTRFLLVSAIGADPRSRTLYLRVKGDLEAAVQALGFPVLGIVRPSFIYGHRDERRPGESIVIAAGQALAPLMAGPLRPYRPVSALQVASALARLATTATPGVTVWSREIAAVAREKSCRDS